MSIRRVALLVATGIVVGLLVWALPRLGGSDAASTGASGTPSTSDTPAIPTASPAASPAARAATSPPPSASASPTLGRPHAPAATASAAPGGTLTHGGSEILPSPSSAASAHVGLPGLKPVRSTTAPLVSAPLPRRATGRGVLVTGYPTALAPPARYDVAVSSVSPSGTTLQVGLTASCRRPCDALRFYRLRLAARGFTEVATASVENAPTAAFQRGADNVTVTVTGQSRNSRRFAVFAILHATRA